MTTNSLLRINRSGATILARLLTTLFLTIATLITPQIARAACSAKLGGACPANQSLSCSYTNTAGGTGTVCCGDAASCNAYQAAPGTNTGSNAASIGGGAGTMKVDPESGCGAGINTALGCIPYDTKGFTAALLGFLAGVVGLIAILVMLFATIMIMTGGTNPEQVKKGKELFTGGITGLFFIIFSVTILRIIAGDIIKVPGF